MPYVVVVLLCGVLAGAAAFAFLYLTGPRYSSSATVLLSPRLSVDRNADTDAVRALVSDAARRIDARGKTVLPGFVDAHTHLIFAGDRVKNLMDRMGMPDDEPIEHPWVTKSVENAQMKAEQVAGSGDASENPEATRIAG